jgi:hypothetical protein
MLAQNTGWKKKVTGVVGVFVVGAVNEKAVDAQIPHFAEGDFPLALHVLITREIKARRFTLAGFFFGARPGLEQTRDRYSLNSRKSASTSSRERTSIS